MDILERVGLPIATLLGGYLVGMAIERASAKRAFDDRMRIEKEHAMYLEVWDKLFEFRRAAWHTYLIVGGGMPADQGKKLLTSYDGFQEVLRRYEPFLAKTVCEPASKADTTGQMIATEVISRHGSQDCRERMPAGQAQEEDATERGTALIRMGQLLEALDSSYQRTCDAIRDRLGA